MIARGWEQNAKGNGDIRASPYLRTLILGRPIMLRRWGVLVKAPTTSESSISPEAPN
jgi:hypothetical protein